MPWPRRYSPGAWPARATRPDNPPWHYGALSLAAFRGNQATAAALISSIMRDVTERG